MGEKGGVDIRFTLLYIVLTLFATWTLTNTHPKLTQTHKSTRLTFENFNDPFITHGIDVIPASSSHPSEAVYIFAVNHIPGAGSLAPSSSSNKDNNNKKKKCHLASRIDVFHHTLGTTTARYLHSISHPSIHTPNDVYGVSANEIYVTNDRWYEEGFMTMVETLWPGAKWSDVVHATRAVDHEREGEGEAEAVQQAEIQANIAIDKLRIPNGLGHGRTDDEILLTSAFGGIMWLGTFSSSAPEAQSSSSSSEPTIQINDTVDLASTIDNPSWYQDQYISSSGNDNDDASGFVLAGLKRAINLGTTGTDPHGREGVMVWYVKPNAQLPAEKWEKKLLWEDDGGLIRNAATAVLVGIDPAKEKSAGGEGGGKKAWLYVTGFSSQSAVAVKVDL